ncbi:secreted RxLR effector protein 78-like [Lycium ferocissimum]|uniref:secreted RxLR effector protein 78-like n=1 Tax=Lycium ferocissimum TaxID=112874 RepID=UPI0028163A7B|nr:secreted RxLR effector protein 78-like [Lycium ferocissimum]
MIKVDLQKAYDSVEWVFLEQVMEGIGFPAKFSKWIMTCVKIANYSILVNREPCQEPFDAAKGLRQGDPISPFLFVLAMEYLSRSLNLLKEKKEFKYHPKCAKLGITHLRFTDDLLLFARGDLNAVSCLQNNFLQFSTASALQANMDKSSVILEGSHCRIEW